MNALPECPECGSSYTYEDRDLYVCPEFAHEWAKNQEEEFSNNSPEFLDANGNLLQNGDTVVVTKDLKVKGTSSVIKVGTRVKNIRLNESDHHIDCKFSGIGNIQLLAKVVKKA